MGAVTLTFVGKTTLYGESKYSQILTRTITGQLRSIAYNFRYNIIGNNNIFASVPDRITSDTIEATENTAIAIPVLTYHAIISPRDPEDINPESFEGHNVELKQFEDQMFALKHDGWETVNLEEFRAFMQEGQVLPKKSFLLTFDDGSKESYYPVDPLLKSLGYEAVTFILPKESEGLGSYYYLSQNEISRALSSGRWEVGSHSYDSHIFVPTSEEGEYGAALVNRKWMPEESRTETEEEFQTRVIHDLILSKKTLEKMFGRPIAFFAFPFGEYGQVSRHNPASTTAFLKKTVESLYQYAFYQWFEAEGYSYNYMKEQPRMIKRISVHPSWTGEDLLTLLQNGMPKDIPFRDTFETDAGWKLLWGTHTIIGNEMEIRATFDSTGATSILDGTKHWTDYTAHIELASPRQTGVTILIRFRDVRNYAVCNLGNGFAHIEQMIDGENHVLKGNRSPEYGIPTGPFTIDATVKGRSVSCSMNGTELVSTTFLDPTLNSGGIGIKTWDPILGKSTLLIDRVNVSTSN